MRNELWMENLLLQLPTTAGSNTYFTPAASLASCQDHMMAGVLLVCDSFSGGTITATLQSAVANSINDYAWNDLGSPVTFTAVGVQTIWIGASAALPPLGVLRLKLVCTVSTTTFTMRAQLLQKKQVEAMVVEWMNGLYLNFSGSGSLTMPADAYADCARFSHAFVLCEFNGSNGSNLTVTLQTAPYASADDSAWADAASVTLTNSAATINGMITATNPPMGVLRLKYVASAACSGTVRMTLLIKEA